jgi:hypothetical protein
MTKEEIDFIKQHEVNFMAVELGYTRNIDFHVIDKYISIYRTYLDQNFILNAWCKHCVFDMLKRLKTYCDSTKQPNETNVKTKNTRSRK